MHEKDKNQGFKRSLISSFSPNPSILIRYKVLIPVALLWFGQWMGSLIGLMLLEQWEGNERVFMQAAGVKQRAYVECLLR